MKTKPLLSIYIPTYNRADKLISTLSALVQQIIASNGKAELIISDNNSNDMTEHTVRKYSEICPLRLYKNESNIGAAKNAILGWNEYAEGEFTWIIGDDDIPRYDAVDRILGIIEKNHDIDYIFVNCSTRDDSEWTSHNNVLSPDDFPDLLPAKCNDLNEYPVDNWNDLINKDIDDVFLGALMCSVVRTELVRNIVATDEIDNEAYSSLLATYPQAVALSRCMPGKKAYYLGYPCTITFWGDREWNSYIPLIVVLRLSELIDLYEDAGINQSQIHRLREFHISRCIHFFDILLSNNSPGRQYMKLEYFRTKYAGQPAYLSVIEQKFNSFGLT